MPSNHAVGGVGQSRHDPWSRISRAHRAGTAGHKEFCGPVLLQLLPSSPRRYCMYSPVLLRHTWRIGRLAVLPRSDSARLWRACSQLHVAWCGRTLALPTSGIGEVL